MLLQYNSWRACLGGLDSIPYFTETQHPPISKQLTTAAWKTSSLTERNLKQNQPSWVKSERKRRREKKDTQKHSNNKNKKWWYLICNKRKIAINAVNYQLVNNLSVPFNKMKCIGYSYSFINVSFCLAYMVYYNFKRIEN